MKNIAGVLFMSLAGPMICVGFVSAMIAGGFSTGIKAFDCFVEWLRN